MAQSWLFIYGIRNPGLEGAQSEISQADMQLAQGNDSIALAQYMAVADDYSNSVANRANLNAAILLYNDGKYDEAIGYISNFDPEGVIIGPASQSLLGDCYVNTGKLDEALAAYDKAIALSANNSYYTRIMPPRPTYSSLSKTSIPTSRATTTSTLTNTLTAPRPWQANKPHSAIRNRITTMVQSPVKPEFAPSLRLASYILHIFVKCKNHYLSHFLLKGNLYEGNCLH